MITEKTKMMGMTNRAKALIFVVSLLIGFFVLGGHTALAANCDPAAPDPVMWMDSTTIPFNSSVCSPIVIDQSVTIPNATDHKIVIELEKINDKDASSNYTNGYLPGGESLKLSFSVKLQNQAGTTTYFSYLYMQLQSLGLKYALVESPTPSDYETLSLTYNPENGLYEVTLSPGSSFKNKYLAPFNFYVYAVDIWNLTAASFGYSYRFDDTQAPQVENIMTNKYPQVQRGTSVKLSCNAVDGPVVGGESYGVGVGTAQIWVGVITGKTKNQVPQTGDPVTFYNLVSEGSDNYSYNYNLSSSYPLDKVVWYYFVASDLSVQPSQNTGYSALYYFEPSNAPPVPSTTKVDITYPNNGSTYSTNDNMYARADLEGIETSTVKILLKQVSGSTIKDETGVSVYNALINPSGYTLGYLSDTEYELTVSAEDSSGNEYKDTIRFFARTPSSPPGPPTPQTRYSITGNISTVGGAPLPGVTVNTTGGSGITDATGTYTIGNLPNGNYVLSPNLPGYTFNPAAPMVTINGADVLAPNIIATPTTNPQNPVTSLSITREGDSVGDGVRISWSNSSAENVQVYTLSGQSMMGIYTTEATNWVAVPGAIVPNGTNFWVHTNQVGQGTQAWYKVLPVSMALNNQLLTHEVVGKFDILAYRNGTLFSLPLIPNSTNPDVVIGDQATGGTAATSDKIYTYINSNWYQAFLSSNTKKWQGNMIFNGVGINADRGYWIIVNSVNPEKYFTVVGDLPSQNRSIDLIQGMNLLGTTFPSQTTLEASGLTNVLTAGINPSLADIVYDFIQTKYQLSWLRSPAKVFTGDVQKLIPGRGYWLKNQNIGAGEKWIYPKPY